MQYWCRETCGLCRLPTGRPQPLFDWSHGSGGGAAVKKAGAAAAADGTQQAEQQQQLAEQQQQASGKLSARSEWHSLHTHGPGGEQLAGAQGAHPGRAALYAWGMLAWGLVVAAAFGMVARSLWKRRRGRAQRGHHLLASAAALPTAHKQRHAGGSGVSSGTATPMLPLPR